MPTFSTGDLEISISVEERGEYPTLFHPGTDPEVTITYFLQGEEITEAQIPEEYGSGITAIAYDWCMENFPDIFMAPQGYEKAW